MNKYVFPVIAIVTLVIIILASVIEYKSIKKDAFDWISLNGETIATFEECGWSDAGPYHYDKNNICFKITTDKNNIFWFRYNLFGREIQKETDDGHYVIVH